MTRMAAFVAATTEEIYQTWHDYGRYLEAQLTLITADDTLASAFEQDHADDAAARARATLAAIPASRRAVFDTVVEQERQRALIAAEASVQASGGRGPLDPQLIEQAVLQQLHDEAHGIGTPTPGRGLVPLSPDAGDWYEVDAAALDDAPPAGAYLLRAADQDDRRRGVIQAGIVAALAVSALLVWLLWPSGQVLPARDAAVAPAVGERVVDSWALRQLRLVGISTTLTLAVSTTTTSVWPAITDSAATAFWRAPALLPLTLCLPAALLNGAATVQLVGEPGQPQRSYTLAITRPTHPDLVVQPCQDGAIPARYGMLTDVALPQEQAIGAAVALGGSTLTVQAIRALGSGDDPTLPPNRQRVEVVVQTAQPLDWPRVAPTLLLLDGQSLLPSAIAATPAGAVLRYLVPETQQPRVVLWQLTPPAAGPAQRWRATLAAPPTRLAVLRTQLRVERAAISAASPGTITVVLTLRNVGSAPLVLTPADLTATADGQALPLPDLAALQAPLAPDAQRTLTLELSRPQATTALVLTLGPYRYALGAGEGVMLNSR